MTVLQRFYRQELYELRCRRSQRGIGLVELMIAMVLGLFLIGGVIQLFIGTKSSYKVMEGMSRLQENARYAMSIISREINAAGYMGCLDSTPAASGELEKITNTLGLATGQYDFSVSVTGSDGTGSDPTDTLTIRRAVGGGKIPVIEAMSDQTASVKLDSTDADYASLEQYQILTLSDCAHASVFMITNDPSSSGGVIEHHTGVTAPANSKNPGQYNSTTDLEWVYGSPSMSIATVLQATTATFDVDTTNGSLRFNGEELVRGVSDMQVEYGFPAGGTTRYLSAGSLGANDWALVEAVRVTLVFDTVEPVTTSNQKIDRTYTTTFRLRNRAPDKS